MKALKTWQAVLLWILGVVLIVDSSLMILEIFPVTLNMLPAIYYFMLLSEFFLGLSVLPPVHEWLMRNSFNISYRVKLYLIIGLSLIGFLLVAAGLIGVTFIS